MRQKRRLLMAALLAVAVSTQGFAQPEALSEDELEEVSAQGLQIVENHNATFGDHGPINSQNNNLDSVQVNDDALSGAVTGYGAVLANSAVNSTANYLYDTLTPPDTGDEDEGTDEVKAFSNYFEQTNEQEAKNHVNVATATGMKEEYSQAEASNVNKQSQRIGTGVEEDYELTIVDQDNNNNSVQLNENAQKEAAGMVIINAAASAVNAGENLFYAGSVSDTEGMQANYQLAMNYKNEATAKDGEALAYNAEYQNSDHTQIVSNAGLVLSHEDTVNNKDITIEDQDNNNNSVQLNDKAQRNASFVTIKNIANSAVNNGINAVYVGDGFTGSDLQQINLQGADNHVNVARNNEVATYGGAIAYNENKQSQIIDNTSTYVTIKDDFPEYSHTGTASIEDQDNNNNSVQLNDQAQREATGMIIENTAMTAGNKGINLLGTASITDSSVTQINEQSAANFNNYASGVDYAFAGNGESGFATQEVINHQANIEKQDNNNNSVQINNTAQKDAKGLFINNIANSAENVGVNVLSGGDVISLDRTASGEFKGYITQTNDQSSGNHRNQAYVEEGFYAGAGNYNKERQVIDNSNRNPEAELAIVDQDNNNNSVQLNDQAQYRAEAGVISNVSMSAANTGVNVMAVGDILTSEVSQSNSQYAGNFTNTAVGGLFSDAENVEAGATQDINNNNEYTDIMSQENNNNSVQLNNESQRYVNAYVVENVANSAKNTAINGMVTGAILGEEVADADDILTVVSQSNTQTAESHLNKAEGYFATAANINKETQVIRNFTVDNPRSLAYIEDQDNNNNSVQLNNNAQRDTVTGIMENVSLSASNTGLNLLSAGAVEVPLVEPDPNEYGDVKLAVISQSNTQSASNFNNEATGVIASAENSEFTGGIFETPYGTEEPEAGQMIENIHGNIPAGSEQNNNNNSVQLNDNAQKSAASLIISNIANSATNIAVNMMTTGDISNAEIVQENYQEAFNHVNIASGEMYAFAGNLNKQKQYIYNCNCTAIDGEQNNNMNSVQLNDNAQSDLQTLVLLNSANSAANIGVNVLHAGVVSGSAVVQKNTATAVNFSNTATGGQEARAINAENYMIRW
ncbi:hypothetical protein [Persephonella sp.]